MNAFDAIRAEVVAALCRLQDRGELTADLDFARVQVEPPRDAVFGDAATNAALVLAKPAGMKPLVLATALAADLQGRGPIGEARPAAPGFVNLRLQPGFWLAQIPVVLREGVDYGRTDQGAGQPINVEYCSANPTGPLHVGHGRGTVFGDALANLMERAGYAVTREYYINDGGAQIETLARSIHHRYRQVLGDTDEEIPAGCYPLKELIPVAEAIAERDGRKWLDAPETVWRAVFGEAGIAAMMVRIKADLGALGVRHDVFTSERALATAGKIEAALAQLEAAGWIYTGQLPPPRGKPVEDWEPADQLLFKSTAFGDEIDRPLQRSAGAWTYFAADLAYHLDKYQRGFLQMIDIWGADHGGYVKRMQAAIAALSAGQGQLDIRLCQLVNLLDGGQPLKISKRAGRIVTLRDVIDEVGADVFRFIMLTRKNDATLDFDLVKVKEQSKDNPVFYVQYAHARICSAFGNAEELGFDTSAGALAAAELERLVDEEELRLVKMVAQYPRTLIGAVEHREPHRIAFYLYDLASVLHALWTKGRDRPELRFLRPDAPELTLARLAMMEATRLVIVAGLAIVGVEPLRELH